MQVQNRPAETLGWSVRNYAPASPRKTSAGSRCAPAAKAASGKSFTIEALLARPEWPGTRDRSSAAQSGPRLPPAAAPLNFAGLALPPVQYLCSPGALHPSSYPHPGYSVYCCPPLSYAPSCRETFYAQAGTGSKVNGGLHQFKTKGGKSKRMRTSFTSEQLSRLEKEFARQQYMVGSERFLLASALQLTEAQVKVWFQNRRIKWRKQSLEQQQAKLAKLGLAAPPKSPVSQGQGDQAEDDEDFSDSDVEINVSDDSVDHC